MNCPHCGYKNNRKAKFCQECGETLVEPYQAFDEGSPEFDFSPIGADLDPSFGDASEKDLSEEGKYLVGSEYRAPEPNWRSGDTMELPPLEGEDPRRPQQFRVPELEEGRGRGKRIALILAAIAVLAGVAFGGYLFSGGSFPSFDLGNAKGLPDVVGMNKGEASEVLEEQGFTVKVMEVKSDDTPDRVLLMDPSAGRRISPGSEVVLQVATPRVVPDIMGLSQADALVALEKEGLEKVEHLKRKSDEPEGTVLAVDPVAGTVAKASTPIKVTLAEPFTVPDVVGMDLAGAIDALEEEGYEAYQVLVYSDLPEGTVVSSDPAAGTKLASGSTVTISIAKSRAAELIEATQVYLASAGSLAIEGTTYEIVSPDDGYYEVSYQGNNLTQATLTVVGVATLPDGEVVRGAQKQREVTFVWNDDNTLSYIE
ncbi:MAG: PASTA domain-containing protein [Eggerthellaceae bacterium]|jgi:serine/threonine-protein kinase|nr:PASTA domain-containing protein [Eggerthellaceae bacterium]MDR2715322.1 PASTA domain-containing protein [Coriobacteriaceae bacterium]